MGCRPRDRRQKSEVQSPKSKVQRTNNEVRGKKYKEESHEFNIEVLTNPPHLFRECVSAGVGAESW